MSSSNKRTRVHVFYLVYQNKIYAQDKLIFAHFKANRLQAHRRVKLLSKGRLMREISVLRCFAYSLKKNLQFLVRR